MLRIEEGTPFYRIKNRLAIPDDDTVVSFYLDAVDHFESAGLGQYEISNFALSGKESRHNLKYWRLDDYLGVGPGAHSLANGDRFYSEPDLRSFIDGKAVACEGAGGGADEYLMLSLRTRDGFDADEFVRHGGNAPGAVFWETVERLAAEGLATKKNDGLTLTPRGMAVQNPIILTLADSLDLK